MRTLGIDVSHYQGNVNWHKVAASAVRFAFAKATEGSTLVDDTFSKNWFGIQNAGLFRGAYHFGHPGGDPETQAVKFASVVGPLGFRDLPPALDLETADGHSAQYVLDWARAFLLKAEQLFGRQLIVYTGQFWRGPLHDPKDEFFGKRALWLAGYRTESLLQIPASWSRWTFWQYSDGTFNQPALIPGVVHCDQSLFEGGTSQLDALCQGVSPTPEPTPEPGTNNSWPGGYFVWPRTPAVSGASVKVWQARMTERGFAIDCDGVYGPQSKNACLAFQRDRGLVADGIVGKATWNATFAA